MRDRMFDRRALVSTVSHAIIAFRVLTGPIAMPVGLAHQFVKGVGIAFINEQVARFLPTEDVVGRITPWRAFIGLIAGQKIQVQARVIERPAAFAFPTQAKNVSKQALGLTPAQENILSRRMLVFITG